MASMLGLEVPRNAVRRAGLLAAMLCCGCGASTTDDGGGAPDGGWSMPNARGSGLPAEQSFAVRSVAGEELVDDQVTGLTWQRNVSANGFSWRAAKDYCETLSYGGSSEWALPTRLELVSLLDNSRITPAIDLQAFPNTVPEWFWSSTPFAGDPARAWHVYFYPGAPDVEDISSALARCVARPESAPPKERFRVAANTVRDLWFGLTWQRHVADESFSFALAGEYCAALELDGERGFRVPSMKELTTLVDETRVEPAMDLEAFPDAPNESFWSSTPWAFTAVAAWHVRFQTGVALYETATYNYRVRCVRSTR
ncbi:MAG TPA: DUF1566 domain-containing protein [Polyangiaceae bacterium]|nr:DUF1566 domain-containing protein [Polyangiaceae bacterium]